MKKFYLRKEFGVQSMRGKSPFFVLRCEDGSHTTDIKKAGKFSEVLAGYVPIPCE